MRKFFIILSLILAIAFFFNIRSLFSKSNTDKFKTVTNEIFVTEKDEVHMPNDEEPSFLMLDGNDFYLQFYNDDENESEYIRYNLKSGQMSKPIKSANYEGISGGGYEKFGEHVLISTRPTYKNSKKYDNIVLYNFDKQTVGTLYSFEANPTISFFDLIADKKVSVFYRNYDEKTNYVECNIITVNLANDNATKTILSTKLDISHQIGKLIHCYSVSEDNFVILQSSRDGKDNIKHEIVMMDFDGNTIKKYPANLNLTRAKSDDLSTPRDDVKEIFRYKNYFVLITSSNKVMIFNLENDRLKEIQTPPELMSQITSNYFFPSNTKDGLFNFVTPNNEFFTLDLNNNNFIKTNFTFADNIKQNNVCSAIIDKNNNAIIETNNRNDRKLVNKYFYIDLKLKK